MFKKIVSTLLAGVMVLSLAACGAAEGGQESGSSAPAAATDSAKADGDYAQITYAFVTFNTVPDDTSDVEEALNQITRDKIGVEVHLMPLSIADYSQQVSLAVQNGEVDIFHTLGDLGNSIASDMCYDITDMLDTDAPELKALFEEEWLKTTMYDGRLYAIPTLKPFALQPMLIYRKDLAEEALIKIREIVGENDPFFITARIVLNRME